MIIIPTTSWSRDKLHTKTACKANAELKVAWNRQHSDIEFVTGTSKKKKKICDKDTEVVITPVMEYTSTKYTSTKYT